MEMNKREREEELETSSTEEIPSFSLLINIFQLTINDFKEVCVFPTR